MKASNSFNLGTTSYIIPDNILPNVQYLAGKVDDIQLILFESTDASNLPSADDIKKLREIAQANNLTYSIHFPLDAPLGAKEPFRTEAVKSHIRIIELTQSLHPSVYIMHLEGDDKQHHGRLPSDDMPRWLEHNRKSIKEILSSGIAPEKLCVETLSYPFEIIENIVTELGLSICLDIGHIILNGYSVDDHLARYMSRTRSVHLHGIIDGKDHCSIAHLPKTVVHNLINAIDSAPTPVALTLEVFNEDDFKESIRTMEEICNSR